MHMCAGRRVAPQHYGNFRFRKLSVKLFPFFLIIIFGFVSSLLIRHHCPFHSPAREAISSE